LVKVYDNGGHFVRQLGRRGAAQGQYEVVRNLLVAPDSSIQVLDGMLGRRSSFSRTGRFLGSDDIPAIHAGFGRPAVIMPDHRLVVNSMTPAGVDSAVPFLNAIGQSGEPVQSFGDSLAIDAGQSWLANRLLWASGNNELFVGVPYTFAVETYGPDLKRKASFRRVAAWAPSRLPRAIYDGVWDRPLTPQLIAMWQDSAGLLWLGMAAPSRSWSPGPSSTRKVTVRKKEYSTLIARPRVRTILEVVDLPGRRVVARLEAEGSLGNPFGAGYFAQTVNDSTGKLVRISRVRLVR
jgi:hypothetical protein